MPAQAADCRPAAIERLRAAAPEGFAIYQKIRDKKFFLNWIACDEAGLGLPTAVHESVHYITAETDAFPLIGGGELKRLHEVSAFFAPSLIAGNSRATISSRPICGRALPARRAISSICSMSSTPRRTILPPRSR
ncbi:MAG TPA: hypothetical protein VIT67_03655 [Povalibacter sp.]